ncbi:hypothetical protein [Colwellia sp. TT2012]|uniref:hypothetical protein n=1 Tax=Colwellia sp. TT2012 TaxID=1720342 RepID=UPI000A601561|nr:hypothetical protein [Colwellia sp. TT2012]
MQRLITIMLSSLFLITVLPAHSANNTNILVIGNDANKGSVSRNNPIFTRVIGALANNMHDNNFDVYDETAITLEGFAQDRVNRSDAEIIDIARSIKRPPIDIAVIFSIYVNQQNNGYTTKVTARIEGRLLNVQTGRRLGNFEIDSGRPWNVPSQCHLDCILENSSDKSRLMANDLGAVLAEKLAWLTDGGNSHLGLDRPGTNNLNTGYSLIFDGFSGEIFAEIEEYLVNFSGYDSYRPVEIRYTRTEIWYKSSIGTAKLNRNLKKMLTEMNLTATINFSGNTFTVKKITLRGKINNQMSG